MQMLVMIFRVKMQKNTKNAQIIQRISIILLCLSSFLLNSVGLLLFKYFYRHYAMIINQFVTQSMDQCQISCCLCKVHFSECSQPRMMPNCEHNACSSCLKHSIMIQKKDQMICGHCGHHQSLKDVDIQSFPKNISLMKRLKETTYSIKISSVNHQSSHDTSTSASTHNQSDFCQQHKKKTDLICINDRVKLCPHCALFGSHQNHQFKTVNEVKQLMESRYQKFLQYKQTKRNLDANINSSQFKEHIVKKIGQEKDRLIFDIKKKFAKITENIKLAEKKAYEDVIKNFKTVYSKIISIMKEENQSQKKYKMWQSKCSQLFQKAAKMRKIQDKIILYIDGPLQIGTEGSLLLHRLQSKINNSITSIETLISQIKVQQNNSISNSVFNYINVVLQDNETLDVLGYMPQDALSPRKIKEAGLQQHKIQFGPDHLAAERMSLSPALRKKFSKSSDNLTKMCSQKRLSCKVGTSTPERGSVNTLIEQFCERDLDTLDLTSYSLSDNEIYDILTYLRPIKKIKGLKLVKNKLTNDGLVKIMELIPGVTNLNLSFNQLCDESMTILLAHRSKIPYLRIINLSNNKINERRTKNSIDQLKKQGLIVTI